MEAELEALEERLANPSHETRDSLAVLLAPGFREYGSSGLEYDADAVLEALLVHERPRVRFTNFRAVRVGVDAALVTYGSHGTPDPGSRPPALRSSLWHRHGGSWQLLFHQGTPMGGKAARE